MYLFSFIPFLLITCITSISIAKSEEIPIWQELHVSKDMNMVDSVDSKKSYGLLSQFFDDVGSNTEVEFSTVTSMEMEYGSGAEMEYGSGVSMEIATIEVEIKTMDVETITMEPFSTGMKITPSTYFSPSKKLGRSRPRKGVIISTSSPSASNQIRTNKKVTEKYPVPANRQSRRMADEKSAVPVKKESRYRRENI